MIWHVFLTDISRQESIWSAIAKSVLQLPTSPLGVDKMEAMEALVPNHALASTSPSAVSVAVVEPLVGVAEALVRVGFVNL